VSWVAIAALLGVAVLAGCGGGGSGWSDAACRREAGWLAERADAMVRHYAGAVYPADMSYLGFKGGLDRFEQGGCAPDVLGEMLRRALTPARRAVFVSLLPAEVARSVRQALARGS
jgi:hypothetical protein